MPLHSAIGLPHNDKTCLLKIWSTNATMKVVRISSLQVPGLQMHATTLSNWITPQ